MLKPVGAIRQFNSITYHATLTMNGQTLGTAQRVWKLATPICGKEDEATMKRADGEPLGRLQAIGGCSMSCAVLGPNEVIWFRVMMECCDHKCFKWEYKIMDLN